MSAADQFLTKAKQSVIDSPYSKGFTGKPLTLDDVYIVWFAKVLGNWKALISTDVFHGVYWEVTYNGNEHETYVDTYSKIHNVALPDNV